MEKDTIAAIATPIGSSGIGIIRISGGNAFNILKRIFIPHRKSSSKEIEKFYEKIQSYRLYYGIIRDPEKGYMVDEVLAVMMKSPKSYTREDVIEIQSHSGSVILSNILKLALESGSRLAEPGEFTKRAFLNGRIDLSQAEAIADMISAKTEKGLKLAATHLSGNLKETVKRFTDILNKIQIELEAGIEFADETDIDFDRSKWADTIEHGILDPIGQLIQHYDDGHVLRDGIRLDIVGRPNVGKSSLLNAILQKDKAIVTHLPGTTRDLIEDYTSIDGVPIIITDTAGLHKTEDPVEVIGIHKTKENIQRSDLVLWVIDGGMGFTLEDQEVHGQIAGKKALLVINKTDLMPDRQLSSIPKKFASLEKVFVSAKYGEGLKQLKGIIKKKCMNEVDIEPGRSLVPNFRQSSALSKARDFLNQAVQNLMENRTEELIVSDILSAKNTLMQITGDNINTDILDEIFGKFCIGK